MEERTFNDSNVAESAGQAMFLQPVVHRIDLPNPRTTWQSNRHLSHRRQVIQRLMQIMQHRQNLPMPQGTWLSRLPALVQRVELSLYIRAASLNEYTNFHTLNRRVQSLVISLHREGIQIKKTDASPSSFTEPLHHLDETQAIEAKASSASPTASLSDSNVLTHPHQRFRQVVLSLSPTAACTKKVLMKRKIKADVNLNALSFEEEENGDGDGNEVRRFIQMKKKPQCLASEKDLPSWTTQKKSESDLFDLGDDVLKGIFAFLPGVEVIQLLCLNKYAFLVLPFCVTSLRMELGMLRKLLALGKNEGTFGALRLSSFSNLLDLEIINKDAVLSNQSAEPNPFTADGCPQIPFNKSNDGESLIREMVNELLTGKLNRLKRLSLCSTFANTHHTNAIGSLAFALKSGSCPELEQLALGGNSIGDAGSYAIAEVIKSKFFRHLKHLDLRKNFIGECGIKLLSQAFKTATECHLSSLCLGGNIVTDKAVKMIAHVMRSKKFQSLVFLGLDQNYLEKEGIWEVARVLRDGTCSSLRELCIGDNSIGNSDIQRIFNKSMESSSSPSSSSSSSSSQQTVT